MHASTEGGRGRRVAQSSGEERPRTDSNPQQQRTVPDWYLEVG